MSMGLLLALEGGGTAEIAESDGAHVVVCSSRPSPPGSTLSGTADGLDRPFRVKVRGCKKLAEGGERPFRIEGRFVDITREQRVALLGPV
jgi:hypothetical protein